MVALRIFSIARQLSMLRNALRRSVLDEPIGRTPDSDIDQALSDLRQTRADLFTPAGARAPHRIRMAYMLAAHRIDVRHAVEEYWEQLKRADNYCRYCPNPTRCQHWLERKWHDEAPKIFCPNETLFSTIAWAQAEQRPIGRTP